MKKKKIEFKGSNKSPKMVFDLQSGIIKILGRSTMVNPQYFYPSVISLIKEYCADPEKKTLLIIDLEYFNTLSARYILKITKLLARINLKEGYEAKINWFFDPEDLGLKEEINLFNEIIQHKINAIEYEYA